MPKRKPKRRAWRKADIQDVEEALEDERVISKLKRKIDPKTSQVHELFSIDTSGSGEGLSNASRRAIARAKIFPPKAPNIGLTASEEFKIARAERQVEAAQRPFKAAEPEVFDLWAPKIAADAAAAKEAARSKIQRPQRTHFNVPKTLGQKVGVAPAVIPAHEGQSMNPDSKAFEDLACSAAATELEREREAEELQRKMRPMTSTLRDHVGAEKLEKMDEAEKVRLYRSLVVRSEGVTEAGDGDEDAEGVDRAEGSGSRHQEHWRKKQSFRNREPMKRDLKAKENQIRQQRRLDKSVGQVGKVLKEMKDTDEWRAKRKEYHERVLAKRKELERTTGALLKKRRLGRSTFAEEAVAVPEVDGAKKGMRATPLKGSAITDRLTSIVRRGMLTAPAESTKVEAIRARRGFYKLKRRKKFISPLLRDNLLLR